MSLDGQTFQTAEQARAAIAAHQQEQEQQREVERVEWEAKNVVGYKAVWIDVGWGRGGGWAVVPKLTAAAQRKQTREIAGCGLVLLVVTIFALLIWVGTSQG